MKRVLLIEDNPDQAFMLKCWLEDLQEHKVVHVDNGLVGKHLANLEQFDLVVSDIDLPGVKGLDILNHVRDSGRTTPVMLITGHQSLDYAMGAINGQADALMLKPVARQPFVDKVESLIADREAARSANREVVLAIGAHPDDVEIGCGGALLRHRERGDEVVILTLTGGENGGHAAERALESRRAASMLGATLVHARLQDTRVAEGPETITTIEEVVRDINPSIVYTHTQHDAHQDHRSTHRATLVACRHVPTVYCYQAPSTTIEFKPSHFVEVSSFMSDKIRLLAQFGSQTAKRPYLEDDLITSTARYWGRFAGYTLVEPMEAVRQRID